MRAAAGTIVVIVIVYVLSLPEAEVSGSQHSDHGLRYVTLTRGDIVQNVTAAGTLEAVDTVEISSQLSGQITKVMGGLQLTRPR
jgi:HlyD family secretion protein